MADGSFVQQCFRSEDKWKIKFLHKFQLIMRIKFIKKIKKMIYAIVFSNHLVKYIVVFKYISSKYIPSYFCWDVGGGVFQSFYHC